MAKAGNEAEKNKRLSVLQIEMDKNRDETKRLLAERRQISIKLEGPMNEKKNDLTNKINSAESIATRKLEVFHALKHKTNEN